MSFFPDMGRRSMVAEGDHIRAVGWLHPDRPYPKGIVSEDFLSRLRKFADRSSHSGEALYFGWYMGFHTCEFCQKAHGIGNFGVPSDDLLFVAPEMIVHYVAEHGYCPPSEFVAAVLRSPLPGTEAYQLITEPFRHLHKSQVEHLTGGE